MHRVVHIEDPLRVPSIPWQYRDGVGGDSCNSAGWGGARAPASDKISRSVSLGLSLKYPGYPITTKFESAGLSLITTFLGRVCPLLRYPFPSLLRTTVCATHGFRTRRAMFRLSLPDVFLFTFSFYDTFSISLSGSSFLLEKRDDSTTEGERSGDKSTSDERGSARSLDRLLFQRKGWKGIVERGREKQEVGEDIEKHGQVEPKGKIRAKRGGKSRGEFGCAYDVKHGPVIWRKFKALCQGNCIGVSVPPYAPFPFFPLLYLFFFFLSFFFSGVCFSSRGERTERV